MRIAVAGSQRDGSMQVECATVALIDLSVSAGGSELAAGGATKECGVPAHFSENLPFTAHFALFSGSLARSHSTAVRIYGASLRG